MTKSEDLFESANTQYDNNNFIKAIDLYKDCISETELTIECLINIAASLEKIGEFERSISVSKCILEIEENNIYALYNCGNCFHDIKEFKKAIYYWNELIEINDKDSSAYLNRANAYDEIGEAKKALLDRDKYKYLSGEENEIYFGPFLQKDISNEVLDNFLLKTKLNEEHFSYLDYFNLANEYIRLSIYDKAIKYYTIANQLYPNDLYILVIINRANAYFDNGEIQKALKDCNLILSVEKENKSAISLKERINIKLE